MSQTNPVVFENSVGLRRLPIVVLEKPAQAVPSLDDSAALRRRPADDFIPDALMTALLDGDG